MISSPGNWFIEPISWIRNNVRYISVVFTWDLEKVKQQLGWSKVVIGGPALKLLPDYFKDYKDIEVRQDINGMLQRYNPNATKTSTGCIRSCKFCAVPEIEGNLLELEDWPDLPVICDNNLLATSIEHFDRVINKLKSHNKVDFNQGLDARLLTKYHAERISEIKGLKKRGVRLALDNTNYSDTWSEALSNLRSAGVAKKKISSYALIGFDGDPSEAWARCEWIENQGVQVLPMWFHELDAPKKNYVTNDQYDFGWDNYERRRIMQWFYQHKKAIKK